MKPHYDEDDTEESLETQPTAVSHVQDMHRILANRDRRTGHNRKPGRIGGGREPVVNSCPEGTDINVLVGNDTPSETTPLLYDRDSLNC